MTTLTFLSPTPPVNRPHVRSLRVVRPVEAPLGRPRQAPPRMFAAAAPRPMSCERSYAPDLNGSRLTHRGRTVVALVWFLLVVAAAVPILRSGSGSAPLTTTTVVVEPGDTMWALARSIDAAADPRVVIDAIVELNDLRSGADIRPGEVLVVPIAE